MAASSQTTERAYRAAQTAYAECGVDTEKALRRLRRLSISVHCWQGDDVQGFEPGRSGLGGGLAVTGAHPGRARTLAELRADLDQAFGVIPGRHRVNLHASYGDFSGARVDRDEIGVDHFRSWIDWARSRRLGLDFNPTFFSHPLAASGFTLAHPKANVRAFWVEHGRRCREIGAAFGQALGTACVTNVWIPDGFKDTPVDRVAPRQRLIQSLDAIFARPLPPQFNRDSVEGKLFGLGSESYVAGSHEFYLGYALTRGKILCLDAGHFHPTESIADKISAVLQFLPELLLHVSRGVRWDSDHVVTTTDDLDAICQAVVRGGYQDRVRIGLDYFDASINRVAGWVIGARGVLRGVLRALLEPLARWRQIERQADYTSRLAEVEHVKSLPSGAVWDYYCLSRDVPPGLAWLKDIKQYERVVLARRG